MCAKMKKKSHFMFGVRLVMAWGGREACPYDKAAQESQSFPCCKHKGRFVTGRARNIKRVGTRPEATTFKTEEPSLGRIWTCGLTSRKYSFRMLFTTSVAVKPLPLRHQ